MESLLEEKYSKMLVANGMKHAIAKVVVRGAGELAGEHFGSVCQFASIEFKDSEEPLHLFLKNILPCENEKEKEAAAKMMLKEGTFLTTIILEIRTFCQRQNTDEALSISKTLESLFPKAFYADEKEIVMEDVSHRGFRMLNKCDKHSFSTARVVMKSLGTYHGASAAWLQEVGGKFKLLEKYPFMTEIYDSEEVKEQTRLSLEPSFTTLLNILKKRSEEGRSREAYEKISKYKGKCMETLLKAIYAPNKILNVLGHGDLWNNNLMFSNSMDDVIFIDLQVLRVNSPNLDLVYYLLISGSAESRQKWKELLHVYFDELKRTMEALKASFDWTFEEFAADFRQKAPMGLTMGLFMTIGMEAMQGYDINESESGAFEASKFTETINTWISENPMKTEGIVNDSCRLVEDFELIMQV